jgi:hypothetical protein
MPNFSSREELVTGALVQSWRGGLSHSAKLDLEQGQRLRHVRKESLSIELNGWNIWVSDSIFFWEDWVHEMFVHPGLCFSQTENPSPTQGTCGWFWNRPAFMPNLSPQAIVLGWTRSITMYALCTAEVPLPHGRYYDLDERDIAQLDWKSEARTWGFQVWTTGDQGAQGEKWELRNSAGFKNPTYPSSASASFLFRCQKPCSCSCR